MSAFLVVSTTEKLNWIVDGIIECRPQNPKASTYIGTGKLEKRTYYIHNYSAKDELNKDEEKATDLQELIANQFAHFRKESGVKDNLQIFLLDNPIDQESLAYSQNIYDAIDNVISQHFENNCSLTRILFSYDVLQPCNVHSQVAPDILRSIIQTAADKERIHICYIDNQDRNGAAMALSQEAHNLMLPRMLCDFMMLMSSSNSQYNIRNAVHNDTRIFSLGYAEYMYYFPDVKRYFEYAYQCDIRRYMLAHAKPDIDSLDYDKYPIGIEERVERLKPIYLDVPFDEKITDYQQSIDKQIDDIIVALHDSIVSIKEQAMEDAKKKDAEATAKRRKEMLENGEADETDVEVTTEQDKVEKKYPNYIDRNSIYKSYVVEKRPNDHQFDDNETCVNARKEYLRLIEFVQDREFKQFVSQGANLENKSVADTDSLQSQEERKGCNIFARWFQKEQPQETAPAPIEQDSTDTTVKSSLEQIISISNLLKQKKQYQSLKAFEESLQKEVEQQVKNMNDFCLTSHCASYGSLIDDKKLKEYQSQTSAVHIDAIIKQWDNLDSKKRNLSALYDETKAECKRELADFTYINWDSPAPFVKKDIDIEAVCTVLKDRSIPWVNSLDIRAEQKNNTTFTFYTDNEQWHQAANDKQVELPSGTTMEKSTHISSKIAIFQILQWDEHIIEGLTDAHTAEEIKVNNLKL